jgi:hypothetical protein
VRHLFGFGSRGRKSQVSYDFIFIFVVGDVCISVLDRLQYLVALEGRIPKGVNGYISERYVVSVVLCPLP